MIKTKKSICDKKKQKTAPKSPAKIWAKQVGQEKQETGGQRQNAMVISSLGASSTFINTHQFTHVKTEDEELG